MTTSGIILILVIVAVIMVVIFVVLRRTSRRVNLTRTPEGQKPEWMHTAPPPESLAAAQADGEGVALYDYDEGENVAAAFVEQIEDVLRAQIAADPYLQSYDFDFGTGADGSLDIRVGDKHYTSIAEVPDLRLRESINQAVATYKQRDQDERPPQ